MIFWQNDMIRHPAVFRMAVALVFATLLGACSDDTTVPGGDVGRLDAADDTIAQDADDAGAHNDTDGNGQDASLVDAADTGPADADEDASTTDIGLDADDAGTADAADTADDGGDAQVGLDAGSDTGSDTAADAGSDTAADAGMDTAADAGMDTAADTGSDTGNTPAGDCVSGATGTHAVRFEWAGNGPGSTAYPVYEQNQLPDTSRWHISAASRSFNYTPTFDDTFLGAGGLDLEGSAFIDVELSTAGLSSIQNVTLAIYGRSFNTTSSGSFSWMTFSGSGSSPYGGVANSAPYQWYSADATASFVPGDSGVLLRISADGPSNALIVNTVEICFDAT